MKKLYVMYIPGKTNFGMSAWDVFYYKGSDFYEIDDITNWCDHRIMGRRKYFNTDRKIPDNTAVANVLGKTQGLFHFKGRK